MRFDFLIRLAPAADTPKKHAALARLLRCKFPEMHVSVSPPSLLYPVLKGMVWKRADQFESAQLTQALWEGIVTRRLRELVRTRAVREVEVTFPPRTIWARWEGGSES